MSHNVILMIIFNSCRQTNAGSHLRVHLYHPHGHQFVPNNQALQDGALERSDFLGAMRHPDGWLRIWICALGRRHVGLHWAPNRWKEFSSSLQRASHRSNVNHPTRLDWNERRQFHDRPAHTRKAHLDFFLLLASRNTSRISFLRISVPLFDLCCHHQSGKIIECKSNRL